MAEKQGPVLNHEDRQSAAWVKLKKHIDERIAMLRARNDGNLDELRTARLRGMIADLKYLKTLGDDKPSPPPEDELFND